MKEKAGFTLIEVLVGMLVTMLIMGALVSLFSSSVKAELSGFKQQEVYAQARAAVNDLKTTLRYANASAVFYDISGNKISAPTYANTKTAGKATYTAKIYNSATSSNDSVTMTVEWKDSAKKQIKITKKINTTTQEVYFPSSADNSSFKGDGSDFPLTINETDSSLYHINLPYQYAFAGSASKLDALVTDVLKGVEAEDDSGVPPILLTSGNLTFGSANAKIRTDDVVTLVLNATNVNNYNNGSLASSKSFDVLTNNASITNPSGKINIVDSYNGMTIEEAIEKYSRITKYTFAYDAGAARVDLNTYPLNFTTNQQIQANNVSWGSATGTVINVKGINAIYAQNAVDIGSNKDVSIALASGETSGSLIIYSKSQVNLSKLTIPKEIAVLIYAGTEVNITDCNIENCIVLAKGGTCTINGSELYGMLESAGSELKVEGKCTFGTFKGDPTAIEVFDDILL